MKITIIGNSGGGKTTLATKISQKLNIPHIQLDRFWFESGGLKINNDPVKQKYVQDYINDKVQEFIKKDNWVSDGFYSKVQPLICKEADQLIFLNIPLYRRIMNHIYRAFFSERHPELNFWHEVLFIFDIVKRTFLKGPKMKRLAEENKEKLVHLRSYKEVDDYLKSL